MTVLCEPWIDIVDYDALFNTTFSEVCADKIDIWDALELVPKKYLKIYALALSTAKWHPNRSLEKRGTGSCSLCIVYRHSNDSSCRQCPLFQAGYDCLESNKVTLFEKACDGLDEDPPDTKYADKLYHVLLRLYTEEFKKVFGEDK